MKKARFTETKIIAILKEAEFWNADKAGNLFGTTHSGGDFDRGTVYKLDASGNKTVLYSFDGTNGLESPEGLIVDLVGNLYGTTFDKLFELDTSGNMFVWHDFMVDNPYFMYSGLNEEITVDAVGNIYGTTRGAFGVRTTPSTVFKLYTEPGAGGAMVEWSFGDSHEGVVAVDAAGTIYGTTTTDGDFNFGKVYKLDTSFNETVLYSFTGTDGVPNGVVIDAAGNLYGITASGVLTITVRCTS